MDQDESHNPSHYSGTGRTRAIHGGGGVVVLLDRIKGGGGMETIKLKKIKMSNGEFAECPSCRYTMAQNVWGTGLAWACFRCGTVIEPKTWEWKGRKGR